MKTAVYVGSFDPFTNGHLEIVTKASEIFDKVVIGMGINPNKKRAYDSSKMKQAIETTLKENNLNNVEVEIYDTLSVDLAKKHNAKYFVRGLRNAEDYAYEENLAKLNITYAGIDTIYLRPTKYELISSSIVKVWLQFGKDVSECVPSAVLELICPKQ